MSKFNSEIRNEINKIGDTDPNIKEFIFELFEFEIGHASQWKREYQTIINKHLKL